MKACEICLEKECKAKGGVGSCNCSTCSFKNSCPKTTLHPTIRITKKCTQTCRHCCFSCSPIQDVHMSTETAMVIAEFLRVHEVKVVNLMGGEICCHPNWREILDILLPAVKITRIVSNGDWVQVEPEFAEYIARHNNCYVSISKDRWHTNKNILEAEQVLIKNDVVCKVSDLNEEEFNLVPIGKSLFGDGLYSMFGCYCQNPEHQYSFLIDEEGKIFKCAFGVWDYAEVHDYRDGGFFERFKEFNKVFYGTFIPNCARCISAYEINR